MSKRFEKAVHIHVDDIRHWVVQGMSDSFEWSDETERQFHLAEEASSAMARVYDRAGFVVLMDHCRNLKRMEQVVLDHLDGHQVVKVALVPSLDVNLERNRRRTNKDFDPVLLEPIIRDMSSGLRVNPPQGWLVLDTSSLDPDQAALAAWPG
jgi:hypothetical protein